jgi:hypothetical protein
MKSYNAQLTGATPRNADKGRALRLKLLLGIR